MKRREMVLALVGGREPDVTVVLPYLPPNQPNEGYKGTNIHAIAAMRRKIKQQCIDDVVALLLERGWRKGAPPFRKAEVMVTFTLPTRALRDHDNLISGMKPIFDALHPDKKEGRLDGILLDDNLWVIGIPTYDWHVRQGLSRTTIEIWDTTEARLFDD